MIGPLKRRRVVGLALGGASSVAVLANRGKPGAEANLLKAAEGSAVDFRRPLTGLDAVVRSLAVKLGREARRADTPTAISLPDPLFSEDRFSFADVPDKPDALHALIKWRIAREHRLNAEDIATSYQRLPSDGDPQYLVRFAAKATIDAVEAAARRAGLTPTLIEAQSRFQAPSDPATNAMAQITVSDQWWSLTYRDAATPECHVRSDWRPERRADDLADLAGALTRLIRTMSRAEAKLAVTIHAADNEAGALMDGLAARLDGAGTVQAAPPCDDRALALQAATA